MEENIELVTAIKQVMEADKPIVIKTAEAFKLWSMELVKLQGNAVMPFCDLYRLYFRNRLE